MSGCSFDNVQNWRYLEDMMLLLVYHYDHKLDNFSIHMLDHSNKMNLSQKDKHNFECQDKMDYWVTMDIYQL